MVRGSSASEGRMSIGRSLRSRFEIDRLLGRGGLGDLYRVRALGAGEQLALRTTELRDVPPVLDAFASVIELHQRLAQLPIVRLRACGGDDERAWYVMDFVDGASLLHRVRASGPMAVAEAVPLLVSALATLATLHGSGVVHQDISPRNLFLDGRGTVRLLELGVGAALGRVFRERPGIFATPRVRAPEQLVTDEVDARADVYAIAAVLYYLVTGRKAIAEGSHVLQLASQGAVRPPAFDACPSALRPIFERALALRPDDRFASADELRVALTGVLQ